MTLKLQCITVDAHNPLDLAKFWAEALGWQIGTDVNDVEVWIERELNDPNNSGFPDILFLKNSTPKNGKNRLHLDFRPEDQAAEVARLEMLGAKRIDIGQSEEPTCTWIVMADPEGNEFCVLKSLER